MPANASIKTVDLNVLENARREQGWTYAQLAKLAHLKNRWVPYELLSPKRRAKRRQYLYYRKPMAIKKIAIALDLKEEDYIIKAATSPDPEATQ